MIAALLVVILIAPDGSWSQTVQQMESRAQCQQYKADVIAAMRVKPNGYRLVRVECEAKK